MPPYRKCPFCGEIRMLYQVIDGVKHRICYACFKVQQEVKKEGKLTHCLMTSGNDANI